MTVSPAEDERRRRVYDDASCDREAAASLGLNYNTFRTWRRRAGLPTKISTLPRRRIPEGEESRRNEIWKGTDSDREAAWLVGISVGSFHSWRERRGLANKWTSCQPGEGYLTPQEERRRLDAWASSATLREAAAKVGLMPQAYDSWARRRGIPSQAKAQAQSRLGYREHELRIWQAFCTSLTDRESANKLGIGRNSVKRWRIRNGFPDHRRTPEYWQRLKHEARRGNPVAEHYVRKRFPNTHGLDGDPT